MRATGEAIRQAGVARIFLVHGTLAGDDALGLGRAVSIFWPHLAQRLRAGTLQTVQELLQDAGNYPPAYAAEFEQAIAVPGQSPIAVRRFIWNSQNNHLGRADGAVQLIAELLGTNLPAGCRVLLWGHSHGGNVFALVTNLLAGDVALREQFFAACRPFYRSRWLEGAHQPIWEHVRNVLSQAGNPLAHLKLDFVTFGTPVRYGWDTNGYDQLLHFIYHRSDPGLEPDRVPFPPTWSDLADAQHGDVVQQLGIAGTNTPVGFFDWVTWVVDGRLHRLLQQGIGRRAALAALRRGFRLPDEGQVLLVDYGPMPKGSLRHIMGHAIYTRLEWLLFHAEEVTQRFYAGNRRDIPQ